VEKQRSGRWRKRKDESDGRLVNPRTGRPDGRMRDSKPVDRLVIDFCTYVSSVLKRGPRTVHEYQRDIELFGAFLEGREPIQPDGEPYRGPFGDVFLKASSGSIAQFITHLTDYGPAAVRRKVAVLRRFFRFLRQEGHRSDNPAADTPNIRLKGRIPKALPFEDVMRLIGTRPPAGEPEARWRRDIAILELLYASGIRRAELVGINLSDVDFDNRTIRVIGKGDKERIVFFNRATEAALQGYLRVRPRSKDGALFVSKQGYRLSYQQVGRVFSAYVKLSGLEGRVTPHTMRHSVATHLHQSGVDLMTIKEFLGHESVQTTQIYTKMTMEHVRRKYEQHHLRDRADDVRKKSRKKGTRE
jgi:site-specific recombinase XerD